ncbi:MAG: hypothetical protein ACREUQ_01170 [Burkholderiales bacterium]
MRDLLCSVLIFGAAAASAAPYPLGTMTCDDIGAFASEAMGWRKGGVSKEAALARLETRTYGDAVEKKNLTVILGLVYGSYGNNWSVESAGGVMRSDCLQGRDTR